MKSKRILHLVSVLENGGIQTWLLRMLGAIDRADWEMDFCCTQQAGPLAPNARELGAEVLQCRLRPTVIGFARNLQRILRQGRYDLLHAHLDSHNGPAVWAAHKLGLPVVTTFHNTHFPPMMWWTRMPGMRHLRAVYSGASVNYAVRHSSIVTGVSQAVLEHVAGSLDLPPGVARTLYLGVPTPTPLTVDEKHALRRSLGYGPRQPLVLHVGRFQQQKNHKGLLDVFQRLLSDVPDARLLLVGDGPLRPSIERGISRRKLGDSVAVLGLRSDVPALMQTCDAFLLPSFHEGLPVVLMEASAAGLPVVASRIPGSVEVVQDGVTALLHDVNEVDGMAESTAAILHNPETGRRLAAAGKKRHAELFSNQAAADRMVRIYEDCLPGRLLAKSA